MLTKTISLIIPLESWRDIREDAAERRIPMTKAALKELQPYLDRLERKRVNGGPESAEDHSPAKRAG